MMVCIIVVSVLFGVNGNNSIISTRYLLILLFHLDSEMILLFIITSVHPGHQFNHLNRHPQTHIRTKRQNNKLESFGKEREKKSNPTYQHPCQSKWQKTRSENQNQIKSIMHYALCFMLHAHHKAQAATSTL